MELLLVFVIIGVLVAVAVPAYASFVGPARAVAARANLRAAIPAAEQLRVASANQNYAGISGAVLRNLDPGVGVTVSAVAVHSNLGYCLQATDDGSAPYYYYVGGNPGPALQPGYVVATVAPGLCLDAVGVASG